MSIDNKIIVILGPTSSGKSEVAIRLAKKFNGEIISADSRQIYRGMNVGTGKVEPDRPGEIPIEFAAKGKFSSGSHSFISAGIPHYLIDIISPRTEYNVSDFKKDAEKIIEDILSRGKLPIICGGTGFWIKAVVNNVTFPEVKPNKVLRNMLRNKTAEELFKMLKKADPERAKNIDAKNKVRLIRAIEICKALGKVPLLPTPPPLGRGWPEGPGEGTNKHTFLQIGIDVSKEELHRNIKRRLKKRFAAGMIEEVENLHKKYKLSWKKIQSFGLGYFWIPQYLQSKIKTKEELFEKVYPVESSRSEDIENVFNRVYHAEKDYAKRQMTWFRKDHRIIWLKNYREIAKAAKKFLKS